MVAGERLDCQVDPLMSLQIVVSVEALRALVAFEWSVGRSWLLVMVVTHEVGHLSCMSTVEARHHPRMYADQGKPTVRVLDVGEYWCRAGGVC